MFKHQVPEKGKVVKSKISGKSSHGDTGSGLSRPNLLLDACDLALDGIPCLEGSGVVPRLHGICGVHLSKCENLVEMFSDQR